jgi:hypothetical protein
VLFFPRRSSFRSIMVLGAREGYLYRLRLQPMCFMTSSSKETDEEEQVAPLVVKQVVPPVVRQVAPLVVST